MLIRFNLKSPKIKVQYCIGTLGISNSIQRSTEKASVFAEETGHHHTTVGNVIDMSDGLSIAVDNYYIMFIPHLAVGIIIQINVMRICLT